MIADIIASFNIIKDRLSEGVYARLCEVKLRTETALDGLLMVDAIQREDWLQWRHH